MFVHTVLGLTAAHNLRLEGSLFGDIFFTWNDALSSEISASVLQVV